MHPFWFLSLLFYTFLLQQWEDVEVPLLGRTPPPNTDSQSTPGRKSVWASRCCWPRRRLHPGRQQDVPLPGGESDLVRTVRCLQPLPSSSSPSPSFSPHPTGPFSPSHRTAAEKRRNSESKRVHLCVLAVLVTVYIEAWAVVGNNFPTMRLLLREGWLDSGFFGVDPARGREFNCRIARVGLCGVLAVFCASWSLDHGAQSGYHQAASGHSSRWWPGADGGGEGISGCLFQCDSTMDCQRDRSMH